MKPIIDEDSRSVSFNNGESWISYIKLKTGDDKMNDYRGKMCLIDGEYLAKCVGQDFIHRKLTFEISPDGETFTRYGGLGIEVYEEENREPTFDEIKSKLRRV